MIRLASRLTAGARRESAIRLVLTGAGLALAVTMLLGASVVLPALNAHDVRRAWTQTSEENQQPAQDESTTDPLLWRLIEDRFDGQDLLRVDVAARGPDAPLPPGLQRLPGPGEIAVSPALRELLGTTDPAMLADRFPGRVTATVGRDALASPDDLVVFVGRSPRELGDEEGTITVRSIEASPISRDLTRIMRVAFVVGGAGLLIPIVVFVATATRLAAARRERRLAALRLAGATQRQVGVVAAVEAAIAALAGTAVGFAGFFALRPTLARIPFDGATFYPSDLDLSPAWAALVGLGVPVLAVGAAITSLRRIGISPLGVARRAAPARPTPRPLLLVAAGVALLLLVVVWAPGSKADDITIAVAVGATFVTTIIGIVLSGPWLTSVVARGVARFGRRAPALLAARRLQDNPAAGFRAISGVTLAVFVCTVFSGLASSILATELVHSSYLPADVVAAAPSPDFPPPPASDGTEAGAEAGAEEGDVRSAAPASEGPASMLPRWPELDRGRTTQLVDDLGTVPGVERVVTAHAFPDDPDLLAAVARTPRGVIAPVVMSCDDATALGVEARSGRCDAATVVNLFGDGVEPTGVTAEIPAAELAGMRTVAVAAVTDGQAATIERVRTLLTVGIPGTPAVTQPDIDAEMRREWRTMQRVSSIALSVTLIIAGCSLAVAVAGSIIERKQPFALLRLAGTRLSDLRRMVLAEAVVPLLIVAAGCVGLGLVVAALVLATGGGGSQPFVMPGAGYWLSLVGGLGLALLVVLATLPLLNRLTALDSVRFE